MNLTKKYLEKKYGVQLLRDNGFDDSRLYWMCFKNGKGLFDGWTLAEIEEKLKKLVQGGIS
jgi:hypothetical protein